MRFNDNITTQNNRERMRKSKERIGSPTTKSLVSYERRNAYPPAPANSSNLRQGRPGIAVGLEERPRREPQMAEADHQTATENSPMRRRWGWWRPGLSGGVWKGLELVYKHAGNRETSLHLLWSSLPGENFLYYQFIN